MKKKNSKNQNVHTYPKKLKGKISDTKNVATVFVYFCNYPYGTPCMLYISYRYVIMYIFQDLKPKTGTLAQDFSHFQNVLEKPTYGVLRFQIQNLEHTLRC